MAHWINIHRNNSFVNAMWLPSLCKNSGGINLAQLGLTAGWEAGRQAGR